MGELSHYGLLTQECLDLCREVNILDIEANSKLPEDKKMKSPERKAMGKMLRAIVDYLEHVDFGQDIAEGL